MQKAILSGALVFLVGVGIALFTIPVSENQLVLKELPSPAGPGSEEPNLTVASDGRIYMSWIEAVEPEGHALRFSSRLPGEDWTAPQTIVGGTNWFVSYADSPSIVALPDGALAAHWLVNASEPYLEAYHLNLSISRDAGKSWSAPIIPYKDRSVTQHGLVSLTATPDGNLGAIWLDGRNYTDTIDDVAMMYAAIALDGTASTDVELDRRVCECCQTSTALTPEGLLVVYRDRSNDEIRDIAMVSYRNGQWTEPRVIAADNWEIPACPINGPSISAQARNVVVAWFTAPEDKPRVQAAFSGDGGKTFGAPVRVDEGDPIGRVSAVMLPSGRALISWIEAGKIWVRRISADGAADPPISVSETSMSASSGFPQMDRSGSEVVITWTQPGEPSRVKTAVLAGF